MAEHLLIRCPSCRTTYRLGTSAIRRRVRCKLCKTAFEVNAAPAPPASFDETVLNWLAELDEAENRAMPRPRIISAGSASQPPSADQAKTAPGQPASDGKK